MALLVGMSRIASICLLVALYTINVHSELGLEVGLEIGVDEDKELDNRRLTKSMADFFRPKISKTSKKTQKNFAELDKIMNTKIQHLHALKSSSFKFYIDEFNANDRELYPQYIRNNETWNFLEINIPFFECSDKTIERAYYFRWWTYRKHIKQVVKKNRESFFVISEFLPEVPWSGKYNTISCAAAHHIKEGRWLIDETFLDDYTKFWLREGHPRQYSFWIAHSVYNRGLVSGKPELMIQQLPDLVKNFEALRTTNVNLPGVKGINDPAREGLYFNTDNRDGMEFSIGSLHAGRGYRPTINSYQFGEAYALGKIATMAGDLELGTKYRVLSEHIRALVLEHLWDKSASFFKPLSVTPNSTLEDVRELHGYTPWYFNLPTDASMLVAWKQLMNPQGFYAKHGLTTAEQRHPKFIIDYGENVVLKKKHECKWNGPVWPYASSVALTALINVLNKYHEKEKPVSKYDFLSLMHTYAASHRRYDERTNKTIDWIDENINPYTGDWISRTMLKTWKDGKDWAAEKGGEERGKDYNHAVFADLVITGLIGLQPKAGNEQLLINPLVPGDKWDYFCIDQLKYHGLFLTILWDKTGMRYNKGIGFRVFVNGGEVASSPKLTKIRVPLGVLLQASF